MSARPPRAFAVGSKWTARLPNDQAKHFIVIGRQGDQLELRCIVGDQRCVLDVGELSDEARWSVGWT